MRAQNPTSPTSITGREPQQQPHADHLVALDEVFIDIHEGHVSEVPVQPKSHEEAGVFWG